MKRIPARATLCLLLLALGALVACAQDDDVATYMNAWNVFPQIIATFMFSFLYLAFYAAAVLVTLGYLRLFNGFDNEMIIWIGTLWFGGMILNAVATVVLQYRHWPIVLVVLPLLFGWGVLINTRSFADLTLPDAAKVALVVALVCTPWFGSTWRIHRPPAPPPVTSAGSLPAPVHFAPLESA